jgi:hypothetical protein
MYGAECCSSKKASRRETGRPKKLSSLLANLGNLFILFLKNQALEYQQKLIQLLVVEENGNYKTDNTLLDR